MLIQHTPLAPDVEYFLDCAIEHTEIDGATLDCRCGSSTIETLADEPLPSRSRAVDHRTQPFHRRLLAVGVLMSDANSIIETQIDITRTSLSSIPVDHLNGINDFKLAELWHACHRVQCAIDRELLKRRGLDTPAPAPKPAGPPTLRVVR